MKKIQLTQGKVALVDDDMFECLNQWKWYAHKGGTGFYAVKRLKKNTVSMHKFLMGSYPDNLPQIDHRDGNGLNNQRSNLRFCSKQDNLRNQRIQTGGTSKYRGVSFKQENGKFISQISDLYAKYYLGYFVDEIEAAKAYDKKAIELYGEFARLNFPDKEDILKVESILMKGKDK